MRVKLEEITNYSKGKQINGDELLENGKYVYLNGGINPSGKWDEFNVCGNTITISEGGNSSGHINYINEPFWCGAHCYYLYNGPKNVKYLYYALKSQQDRIYKLRSGACMPNIKKKDLGNFELEFDFDENNQNKVVSVLSNIENIINSYKKELKLYDELIKARFVEMFGDPIVNSNDLILKQLNDICVKITDGTHDTPPRYNSGYLFITGKNIRSSGISFDEVEYVSAEDHKIIYDRCNPEYGDVLYTNIGVNYGTACLNSLDYEFSMKNVALLKPNKKVLNEYYLRKCLNIMRSYILSMNKVGGAQTFMGLGTIKKITIPVPPIELQNMFASFVKQVDKSKVAVQKSLDLYQELFDKLMNDYFGD